MGCILLLATTSTVYTELRFCLDCRLTTIVPHQIDMMLYITLQNCASRVEIYPHIILHTWNWRGKLRGDYRDRGAHCKTKTTCAWPQRHILSLSLGERKIGEKPWTPQWVKNFMVLLIEVLVYTYLHKDIFTRFRWYNYMFIKYLNCSCYNIH